MVKILLTSASVGDSGPVGQSSNTCQQSALR